LKPEGKKAISSSMPVYGQYLPVTDNWQNSKKITWQRTSH